MDRCWLGYPGYLVVLYWVNEVMWNTTDTSKQSVHFQGKLSVYFGKEEKKGKEV